MNPADFSPCPLCKQYSHSIGGDVLATAFNHFQSMLSHRGDGIPTQFSFDETTRDAAQVLMAAAIPPDDTVARIVEGLKERERESLNGHVITGIRLWIESGDWK